MSTSPLLFETSSMALPFHVWCELDGARLYERADGRFQQLERGVLAPWYQLHRCLLVERGLAELLRSFDLDRVAFEPAVVFDPVSGQENHTLARVRIGQFFTPDQMRDLSMDGSRLLVMNDSHVFASPDLKDLLCNAKIPYLRFSEGLRGFG